jgi:hypothetical protein
LQISFSRPRVLKEITVANIELHYKDLLENEYSQKIEFEFEIKNSSVWLKSHTTYPIIPIAKKNTTNEE